MDNLTNFLLRAYANRFKSRLVQRTRQIDAAQTQFLQRFLKHHQDTELGQQFGLEKITTIADFRRQVPIMPYEFYQPYVARIADGATNVLNPDPVIYINLTSGSTGNKKQVPVTKAFQASLNRANLAAMGFFFEALADRGLGFGKMLLTNSAILQGQTSAGINYGPVSVGSLRQGKPMFEKMFSLPFDVLTIDDTFARHYVALLFALRDGHLHGMTTNFPMLLLRTCSYLEHYSSDLVENLATGQINPDLAIKPELRSHLANHFKAAPKRAAFLRQVIETQGYLTPITAWPELSYICTARGGTSDFYFEQFPRYFGHTPVSGGVFGTAEGTFGVYPDIDTDGSILALESGFFEFVAEPDWDLAQPPTLLPQELEVGQRYRILVSSYSGFYRYDIGDVIEVVGFYNQAPLIVFRYRRGGLLSSTTEKTTEFHVTQVMQQLQQEFRIYLEDFCITLSAQESPARYVVNIELTEHSELSHPIAFIGRFDELMGAYNEPYRTVRRSDVPAPQLHILAQGSFAQVRQQRVNRGMFDSQLKTPHISEDRQYLADLAVLQSVDLALH